MSRRAALLMLAVLAAGVILGRVTSPRPPTGKDERAAAVRPRPVLPRPSLAEQHTIVVGEREPPFDNEDHEGRVILRPGELPRVLTYEAEDVERAVQVLRRFVAALDPDLVTDRSTDHVVVDGVHLRWRVEGEGESRLLRVVALPVDPYSWESSASRLAEAVAQFAIVHDCYAKSVTTFSGQADVTTSVRSPQTRAKVALFDAAEAEFRDRGLNLTVEEVAQGEVVALVRDAQEQVLWSFAWRENQQSGTLDVRHYADPFDTRGEQELLLAIVRRSLGRDVRIRLDASR